MSYIARLAGMNWEEFRMMAVDDEKEPIIAKKSLLNLSSDELDRLVKKVASLGEPGQDPLISSMAKKCWKYIALRARQNPIHISFDPYIPPLTKCNKIFVSHYPQPQKTVDIACSDGLLAVPEAVFKVLKRELVIVTQDVATLGIQLATLKTLLDHLCGENISSQRDLHSAFDLMTTACLLGIRHLAQKYIKYIKEQCCSDKTVLRALEQSSRNLKASDKNVFDNEALLESFQQIITCLLQRKPYSDLVDSLKELPIRTLRIGGGFGHGSRVIFGPTMPNLGICPTIRSLEINNWEVTKEGVESLLPLERLEQLTFHGCSFTADALEVLPLFKDLKSLKVSVPKNDDDCEDGDFLHEKLFITLGQCKNITQLRFLRGGGVKDEWLKQLAHLKIQTFKLNRITHFTGQGLAFLHPETLSDLALDTCWDISKDGVAEIRRFPALTSLKVRIQPREQGGSLDVDPAVVSLLPHLQMLRKFTFSHRCQAVSPNNVYFHIPPLLEELSHWRTGTDPNVWIPKPLIIRQAKHLKRWSDMGTAITPIDFEEQVAELDPLWPLICKVKKL